MYAPGVEACRGGSRWFQSERGEMTRRRHQCFCRTMIESLKTRPKLTIDRRAVAAPEYALIAGILAMAVLAASSTLGGRIENVFTDLAHLL